MRRLTIKLLNRLPYIRNLRTQIANQGQYPPGHYYSPIPSQEGVLHRIGSQVLDIRSLPGIVLNDDTQMHQLEEYSGYYDEVPFREQKTPHCRYYYEQEWFCYADAIFLHCFLRSHQPRRIIEVGSGFSSAVMLDTAEHFLRHKPDLTFVEPHPERLLSLLRPDEREKISIVQSPVQIIKPELFDQLEAGDLLFIDSSHVVKCGSDLQYLMFDILPRLSPGVFVHFHDIFYPFEYPAKWLMSGRYWNECYLLRAFLAYNTQWSIYFFNDYVARRFRGFLEEKMPLCLKSPGGSLYLRNNPTS